MQIITIKKNEKNIMLEVNELDTIKHTIDILIKTEKIQIENSNYLVKLHLANKIIMPENKYINVDILNNEIIEIIEVV